MYCYAEPPEAPYGLKVLNKSGRSVQMSWIAPYNGNSPIKRYIVEYKITRGKFHSFRALKPKKRPRLVNFFPRNLG